MEEYDGGCLLLAACRELQEEFKITCDESRLQLACCLRTTCILLFTCSMDGIPVASINRLMKQQLTDASLPDVHKEMSELRWFSWHHVDAQPTMFSALLRAVLKRVLRARGWGRASGERGSDTGSVPSEMPSGPPSEMPSEMPSGPLSEMPSGTA